MNMHLSLSGTLLKTATNNLSKTARITT